VSGLEFMTLAESVIEAVKDAPELARSLGEALGLVAQQKDPTHAMRQVKGQAALAFLGIKEIKT
jgi:hypothetical protein